MGTSQTYATKASAEQGIGTVMSLIADQGECVSDEAGGGDDELVCNGRWGSPLADNSEDLRKSRYGDTIEASLDNLDSLKRYQTAQIFRAATFLGGLAEDEDIDTAFATVDEGIFYLETLRIGNEKYHLVRAYMGDTEVGLLFEYGIKSYVLEIGDGNLRACHHEHGGG